MNTQSDRSALGMQLDAVELMVVRDINRGREVEALRAALAQVGQTLGLKGPTNSEQVKTAVAALVEGAAKQAAAPVMKPEAERPTIDVMTIARDWFEQNPYEDDEKTDEALSYFESYSAADVALSHPNAPRFAILLSDLLNGQGQPELTDPAEIRKVLSKLTSDAAAHRAGLGASAELATLKRRVVEEHTAVERLAETIKNYQESIGVLELQNLELREQLAKPKPARRRAKR